MNQSNRKTVAVNSNSNFSFKGVHFQTNSMCDTGTVMRTANKKIRFWASLEVNDRYNQSSVVNLNRISSALFESLSNLQETLSKRVFTEMKTYRFLVFEMVNQQSFSFQSNMRL